MIVFVGGFSNSDVLGSAKGWAGAFRYNEKAKKALEKFYKRLIHYHLVYATDVSLWLNWVLSILSIKRCLSCFVINQGNLNLISRSQNTAE